MILTPGTGSVTVLDRGHEHVETLNLHPFTFGPVIITYVFLQTSNTLVPSH